VEAQVAELVRTGELKRFLPRPVAESVLQGLIRDAEPFERRKITVLFVDLVGFSRLAEALEPEELSSVANDFLREMLTTVIEHGGTTATASGDGLMVLFGAPQAKEVAEQAIDAMGAAVAMRDCTASLRAAWRRRGVSEEVAVRIGINTGFCTVGVFGSEHLQSYTAVGTPVEIAARLKTMAEAGQILCGMPTFALVEDHVQSRTLGPIALEGVARPIEVFAVEALTEAPAAESPKVKAPATTPSTPLIGKRLAHYQVLDRIGEGAMGKVYRAHDTKLDRYVALKLLPAEMAQQEERRERFEREAKAIASLNHPNIVSIYSVEEAGGNHFITMELVKGDCLTECIPPAGLSLKRFLELARPLVEAVSCAHEQGVIHRDLKPENVMVNREGRVKVLDFGLAKIKREIPQHYASQASTGFLTRDGGPVGTVPYMSPEQVQGKPVDHRSDIFSLGSLFYEMATGCRPFPGKSHADIMASILRDEPESLSSLRTDLPVQLERIVTRCLEKDPERRYPEARKLLRELELLTRTSGSGAQKLPDDDSSSLT
jgi:class 3 adenylate cyclase/tRNA A-37 threonylcarbamoyl transferase component Bud32